MNLKTCTQSGTTDRQRASGEWEAVPTYAPRPGYSARDVAKELGLRILERRQTGLVVAIIDNDFGGYECVKP